MYIKQDQNAEKMPQQWAFTSMKEEEEEEETK